MTFTEPRPTTTQLKSVLEGLPADLLAESVRDKLVRLCLDFDVLGRINGETGEPMVDEHTLRGMLRPILGKELSNTLVEMLRSLPHSALRLAEKDPVPPAEPGWFELAEHVVIYDTEPDTTFSQLDIAFRRGTEDVVAAVQYAFPSFEPELLDPAVVPRRIMELVQPSELRRFWLAVYECDRQLGWWNALMAVLLVPLAVLATTKPKKGEDPELYANAWPLGSFAYAAAVSGWTLTIVENVVLSPLTE